MPEYECSHKKHWLFAKRKRELLHALKHQHDAASLAQAVELLRQAKLKIYKGRHAKATGRPPSTFHAAEIARVDRKLDWWLNASVDEIIMEYNKKQAASNPGT